jgi:hypothetical protein
MEFAIFFIILTLLSFLIILPHRLAHPFPNIKFFYIFIDISYLTRLIMLFFALIIIYPLILIYHLKYFYIINKLKYTVFILFKNLPIRHFPLHFIIFYFTITSNFPYYQTFSNIIYLNNLKHQHIQFTLYPFYSFYFYYYNISLS